MKIHLSTFKGGEGKEDVLYLMWHFDIVAYLQVGCADKDLLPHVYESLQGYPGDLVQSTGKDAYLDDILYYLDEHYRNAMTFDSLSREIYTMKQSPDENVSDFGI